MIGSAEKSVFLSRATGKKYKTSQQEQKGIGNMWKLLGQLPDLLINFLYNRIFTKIF
jgi:hypothetical protein